MNIDKESYHIVKVQYITKIMLDFHGNMEDVKSWFDQKNPYLDNMSPNELCQNKDYETVINFLKDILPRW